MIQCDLAEYAQTKLKADLTTQRFLLPNGDLHKQQ